MVNINKNEESLGGQAPEPREGNGHLVITVHGIRTFGQWQEPARSGHW